MFERVIVGTWLLGFVWVEVLWQSGIAGLPTVNQLRKKRMGGAERIEDQDLADDAAPQNKDR